MRSLVVLSLALAAAPVAAQSHYYDFESDPVNTTYDQQFVVSDGTIWTPTGGNTGQIVDVFSNPHNVGFYGMPGNQAMYIGPTGSRVEIDLLRPSTYFAGFAGTGFGDQPTHVNLSVFDVNGKQILFAGLKVVGSDEGGLPGFLLFSCNTNGGGFVSGGAVQSIPHPAFFYAGGTTGLTLTGLWLNGPSGFPIGRVVIESGSSTGGMLLDDLMFDMPAKMYPGPGHDLACHTRVNGGYLTGDVKTASPGDTVGIEFWSPLDQYDGAPFATVVQAYPVGQHPGAMPGLPEVLVNPLAFPPPAVLFGDFVPIGAPTLWTTVLPAPGPSWPGALGVQGLAFDPSAPNGFFATSDLVELHFL